MEKITWQTEIRNVKDLKIWKENPRKITKEGFEKLKERIRKRGFHDVIKINIGPEYNNIILSGNQRKKALIELGIKKVECKVPSRPLTLKEMTKVALESNRFDGEWDLDLLVNFDEDWLKDVGFQDTELDDIFGLEIDDDFDVEKELKKILKGGPKRVKSGDIWQLGEHRLIIGDCINKKNWKKLLGTERFDFMFTDPPYRLAYIKYGKVKKKGGFGYKANRKYLGVEKRGGVPEYDEWLSIANEFQNPKGANVMIFENWKNTLELWQAMQKYWKIKNMIIWWLPNRCQGFGHKRRFFNKYDIAPLAAKGKMNLNEEYEKEFDDYLKEKGQKLLDTYEVILYSQKGKSAWNKVKGTRWARINDHITHSAETSKSGGQSLIFGTKPIQILVPYIKILSPRNGIVVEPFTGSGSTIIACEIMKRKCRAIEIEPIYGEVILARWERFTGQKAKKLKN